MNSLRSIAILLTALAAPAGAQSIIRTILGAAPDGASALTALLNNPTAVTADRNGNVYAAMTGSHQVVRIDKSGAVWLVAGNGTQGSTGDGGPARLATLTAPTSLAIDDLGNLYIADAPANRVRRVAPDGNIYAFAGAATGGQTGDGIPAVQARLGNPSALAIDAVGNVLIADTGNHVVRRVSLDGTIATVIGTGTKGSSGNDGPAANAHLNSPSGLAIDRAGNIYIADTGNGWIRRVTTDGVIARYAGYASGGQMGFGGEDPTLALNATLTKPTSIAVDSGGNLFLVESASARVRRVTADGKIVSYAGVGKGGSVGDGGLARSASLNVIGIAVDAQDNLLIADGVSNKIRIVTASDGVIETLAGAGTAYYTPKGAIFKGDILYFSDNTGNRVRTFDIASSQLGAAAGQGGAGFQGDGGDALGAWLYAPRGLAFDKSGTLYIADSGNNRVRSVDSNGVIQTVAGSGPATTTGDGSFAQSATLHEPAAVVVDAAGNLYVAERLGHAVRKITTDGLITTVAGTGMAGSPTWESGSAVAQKLNSPQGLAFDTTGALLIADTANNRIRRLTSDGRIETIAGTGVNAATGDGGPATAATFRSPIDVAADVYGNVYIADSANNTIRRIGPDGVITTIAGTGVATYNGDGAPATSYALSTPTSVAIAPGCSIIVGDAGNQRLRRIWPATDYTIPSNPAGLQVTVDGTAAAAPVTVGLLPGTRHHIDAPSPQPGANGVRYVLVSGAQDVDVACGPARASLELTFRAQYSLTVTSGVGGSVTSAAEWQDPGAEVSLTATPQPGYVFSGWAGDCSGSNSCSLTMDGPKTVTATFNAAQ